MSEWQDYEAGRMGIASWFRIRIYGPIGTPELRALIARLETNLMYECVRKVPEMTAADLGLL